MPDSYARALRNNLVYYERRHCASNSGDAGTSEGSTKNPGPVCKIDGHDKGGDDPDYDHFQAFFNDRNLLSTVALDENQSNVSMFGRFKSLPYIPSTAASAKPLTCSYMLRYFSNWRVEIFLAIVIVVLLCALSSTLASGQGQTLPHWSLKITINVLISFYGIVLRGAVLYIVTEGLSQMKWLHYTSPRPLADFAIFDAASRGPLGSLRMLWSLPFQSIAASLGALVVVLSLLIDPFAQQTIHMHPCQIPNSTINASIPRTRFFDYSYTNTSLGVDPTLLGFINAGLFAPSSVTIPFDCPTSNCTFSSVYHTIGFCSSCTDVTSSLVLNCTDIEQDAARFNSSAPNCAYKVVGSHGPELSRFDSSGAEIVFASDMDLSGTARLIWDYRGPRAVQCSFSPCIKSYNSTIKGGKLTEELVADEVQIEPFGQSMLVALDCISDSQRKILQQQGYTIRSGANWLHYNSTMYNNHSLPFPQIDGVDPQCFYGVGFGSVATVNEVLSDYFSGTLDIGQSIGSAQIRAISNSGITDFDSYTRSGVLDFDSVSAKFRGVADAITMHIRQNHQYNLPAQGVVFVEQTCIDIKWEWVTLPAFLGLATIVFLAMTMFADRRPNVGQNWKSSQYPIFFHGLTQETLSRSQNLDHLRDMEASGKRLHVHLAEGQQGFKLVEKHDSSYSDLEGLSK